MELPHGKSDTQESSRERHTRQLALLVALQSEHARKLTDTGLATKAYWELHPDGRKYFDGALSVTPAVYTGASSGYGGFPYRQDFGVQFSYTKPDPDGRILMSTISAKVGESFGDDQLIIAHDRFTYEEAMVVHGMVMGLKLERDLGGLPDLNSTYTGIQFFG